MVPLALLLRKKPPLARPAGATAAARKLSPESLGLSAGALQTLLIIAGLSCCVAMSMPQVHLVAYCGDLGYGAARGAQMLSLMLACGIVSRLVFGCICDRIGGLRTLLLGSVLQGTALLLFLPFNGLVSLYVISALFGLFQGGIVPTYPIIVREFFRPRGSGRARRDGHHGHAVRHGAGRLDVGRDIRRHRLVSRGVRQRHPWNLVNVSIVVWLLRRSIRAAGVRSAERVARPAVLYALA